MDGGQTWETVSLGGEADFHALEAGHGRVYGYRGGQIMVTQDQESWETRGGIALADFAVSATDPDVLLATTQQGLARSTDGGTSFELVGTAPLLQLVSWPEGDTVVGIAPDGAVHVSEDAGDTWDQRGSVGDQPHALEATAEEIFVALDGAVVVSDDGGREFRSYGGD